MTLVDVAARAAQLLPPELAHSATIAALEAGLVRPQPEPDQPELAVRLKHSGLMLPNPIGLAAGFDKNAQAIAPMLGFGFGFVECGTVTPRPQPGNPKPRLFRLAADRAVINRMGFNNDGLGLFIRRIAAARGIGVVGANVGANKDSNDRAADYVAGVRAVWPHCTYVTMNISSPNTPGLRGLQNRGALDDLLGRVGVASRELSAAVGPRPVFLKVAPDLDEVSIRDIAEVVLAQDWLAGLVVANTTVARPDSLTSAHRGEVGGLSGAPLFEPSTRVLRRFAEALEGRKDLIGVGGVSSGRQAWEKIRAGASAVQLYTALAYQGPELVGRIKAELLDILHAEGVASIQAIIPN